MQVNWKCCDGQKASLSRSSTMKGVSGQPTRLRIMPTGKPRYTITLNEETLKKIDDYRFENRFANRTQATLDLIRIGMDTLEKNQAEAENKGNSNSK